MNQVTCPHCKHEFDVTSSIEDHVRKELQKDFDSKLSSERDEVIASRKALDADRSKLEEQKKSENERLQKRLAEEQIKVRQDVLQQIKSENEAADNIRKEELNRLQLQVREGNLLKAQLEQSEREKLSLRESIEAETQRKLSTEIDQARQKIRQEEQENNQFAIREMQNKLDEQTRLVNEQKRKMEQGLTQSQGEVQELAIEEYLKSKFPLDSIEEVKKGQHGADCIQVVNSRTRLNCGKICYESKRTKEFSAQWIEKFKSDIRDSGGGIGVLVTEAMPKGMDRMGAMEGIWVCSFEEFKGLSEVLREFVLRLSEANESQENKADKMVMLYDHVAGQEFRMHIEAIAESFVEQKSQLDSERRSYENIWKKRELQIDKGIRSIGSMYGGIRGIAGAAIGEIKTLELNA